MADTIGSYIYRITGDTSEVNKGIKDTQSTFESAAGKIKGACLGIAAALGVSFGLSKFVSLNKEMVKLAAESEVASKRFGSTFPDALDKASKSIATLQERFSYGDDDAQALMADVGILAQQLGITEEASVSYAESMLGLGADLASFRGESEKAGEMTNALMAATKGMTRECKSLGLFLDDDHLEDYAKRLGKTTDQLNSAEKAQAILNEAQRQMSSMGAIGAAAANLNSYSTSAYRLATAFEDAEQSAGKKLIPAVASLNNELIQAISPGGAFADVLDDIASAGSVATRTLTAMLSKLNEVSLQQKAQDISSQLFGANSQMSSLTRQIENFYGSIENAKKKASGNTDEARNAKRLVRQYDDLAVRLKDLNELNKQIQKTSQKNDLSDMYKKAEAAATHAADSFRFASNAIQDPDLENGRYAKMTIQQIADMTAKTTGEKYAKERAQAALKAYNAEMRVANDLYAKADASARKLKISTDELNISEDKPKPKHKAYVAPTPGKSSGSEDDLKKQIAEAEGARTAILGINAEVLTLAQTISQMDAGQLKDLKANLDLNHASEGAKKFADAFSNVDITKLNQSLLNDSIDKNIAQWGTSLKACGDAAKSINVSPSISDEIIKARTETENWIDTVGKVTDAYGTLQSSATSILNSLASITANQYATEIAALDRQKEKALEVAGVSEDTAVESSEKSYQLALKSGNSVLINSKKNALAKAKIDEEYEKKKSDLEFKAAMRAWEYKEVSAIVEVPVAVGRAISSAASAPWPTTPGFMAAYAGMAGVAAGAQLAAVTASKPKRSNYQEGGIIPGNSFRGDHSQVNVNAGEMIINAAQQAQLFALANGKGGSATTVQPINVYIGNELVYSGIYDGTKNGDIMVHQNGITNR